MSNAQSQQPQQAPNNIQSPKSSTPADHALTYFRAGLIPVLIHSVSSDGKCSCKMKADCANKGKHPRHAGWNKPNSDVFLNTEERIRKEYHRSPRGNVGIVTGRISNIVCLDVDPKHGGNESLQALIEKHGPLPPTWQTRTGSGGTHYLFRHPGENYIVRNSQADENKKHPKLGDGLDIRGDGGQFVAPPSIHETRNKYEWVVPPWGEVPLADLPAWLLDTIATPRDQQRQRKQSGYDSNINDKRRQQYVKKAVENEVNNVINAPPARGSEFLNNAALALGQLVGGGLLGEDEAFNILLDAATTNNRRPIDEAERTIRGGIAKGKTQPRVIPETAQNTTHQQSQNKKTGQGNTANEPGDDNEEIEEHFDDPDLLARAFLDQYGSIDGKQSLRYWREDWLQWAKTRKSYRIVGKEELKPKIWAHVKEQFNSHAEECKQKPKKITAAIVNNVYEALKSMSLLSTAHVASTPAWLGYGSAPAYLALQNGLFDIAKLNSASSVDDILHAHTPEWLSTTCLPSSFDPEATCPQWDKFLQRNLEGNAERIDLLQEWFGYCLTTDTTLQKFMMMVGEGANGKSVICAALTALLGSDNISSVPLELFGERFQLTPTLGKLVNIASEVGEIDKVAEGILKQFTDGSEMQFDRKGKPQINCRPTAKLLLATNTPPRFSDKSGAIWRRLIYFPLNVQIPENERVPGMDRPIYWQPELSGILNWALVGYHRLYDRGRFLDSEINSEALEEYKTESNPVRVFFDEEIEIVEGTWASGLDIYEAYQAWCKKTGHTRPLSSIPFFRELNRHCLRCPRWSSVAKKRDSSSAVRLWGYSNIKVRPHSIKSWKGENNDN